MGDSPTHIARVVLYLSTSPYVDVTDIYFTVDNEAQIAECGRWAFVWAEYEPIFHGGTVEDSVDWVRKLAEPFYTCKLRIPSGKKIEPAPKSS